MEAQLARAGRPGPKAIGIDKVSIRKGHSHRIVVSDLERKRPIWFGGQDRDWRTLDFGFQSSADSLRCRGVGPQKPNVRGPFALYLLTVLGPRTPQRLSLRPFLSKADDLAILVRFL